MGRVKRMRISSKVVIEGNILIKDHHDMLDRRGGWAAGAGGILRRSMAVQQAGKKQDENKGSFQLGVQNPKAVSQSV